MMFKYVLFDDFESMLLQKHRGINHKKVVFKILFKFDWIRTLICHAKKIVLKRLVLPEIAEMHIS